MLIVYKDNKATGITYTEDIAEYYNYHAKMNEHCAWLPNKKLEYDDYGNCITILEFEEIAIAKKYYIANRRLQKQESDLYIEEYNASFYGNKSSQADLTREIASMTDASLLGYWDAETNIVSWKSTDGFVDLKLIDLKKIRLYFSQRTQYLFKKENYLIDLIDNATSIQELENIEWSDDI